MTGAITGAVYVWNGTSIKTTLNNHKGLVDAITVTKTHVITGGRDSLVTIMDKSYAKQWQFSTKDLGTVCCIPRAIDINAQGNEMVIGTLGHEIITIPINMQ